MGIHYSEGLRFHLIKKSFVGKEGCENVTCGFQELYSRRLSFCYPPRKLTGTRFFTRLLFARVVLCISFYNTDICDSVGNVKLKK